MAFHTFTAVLSLDLSDDAMVKRGVTEAILKEFYSQTQPLIIYTREQVAFHSCAGDFKLTFLSQCHLVLHLLVFRKFLEQQWNDVIRSPTMHSWCHFIFI